MEKHSPHNLYKKAMIELRSGADKKEVVLPLFAEAFNELQNDIDFLYDFGMLLYELSSFTRALELLGKVVALKSDHVGALIGIQGIFEITGNLISAIGVADIILKISPQNTSAYSNLGNSLLGSGYHTQSLEAFKKALEYSHKNIHYASNLLLSLNYAEAISREENFAFYEKYRDFYEPHNPTSSPMPPRSGKIKIGFVSADLSLSSVSYFIAAIFENYDKNRFEIHLFSNSERFDRISQKFKDLTDKWHNIKHLDNQSAADLIRKENISVLVDLSGHIGGNRLQVFGLRPAPVQVTYCGYPNTTGLKSIDYRITDNICEPDDAQKFHTEKLFKLDGCFLCYSPESEKMPACEFEDYQNRPIVFGSFNTLSKMTGKTIRLWSNAVNSVANAKLLLKHKFFNDPKLCELTLSRFREHGLSAEKITLVGFNPKQNEHWETYNKIDIALDSFPYNGTTTTCEALYMGVPVITILGNSHVSRVSASLLAAVGLNDFVAKDEGDFVRIAADLAQNTAKLAEIKRTLRDRMQASSLMDKRHFTEKWQCAILKMIDEHTCTRPGN